jgi:hypothetical protein
MVAGLDPVRHQRHDLLWRWSLPFGVAILLAAVCGGLITVLVGICPDVPATPRGKKESQGAHLTALVAA